MALCYFHPNQTERKRQRERKDRMTTRVAEITVEMQQGSAQQSSKHP